LRAQAEPGTEEIRVGAGGRSPLPRADLFAIGAGFKPALTGRPGCFPVALFYSSWSVVLAAAKLPHVGQLMVLRRALALGIPGPEHNLRFSETLAAGKLLAILKIIVSSFSGRGRIKKGL